MDYRYVVCEDSRREKVRANVVELDYRYVVCEDSRREKVRANIVELDSLS